MHIVFKDKCGDIKWGEKIKVESLEAFAENMNKRVMEMGSKRPTHWVESPHIITVTEWDGKLKGTYHICSETGAEFENSN
jgi:hypothetical protein